jgi:hypothetical protein
LLPSTLVLGTDGLPIRDGSTAYGSAARREAGGAYLSNDRSAVVMPEACPPTANAFGSPGLPGALP